MPADHTSTYHIPEVGRVGGAPAALPVPCRPEGLPQTRVFWFQWVVESPGLLAFDLLPDNPDDDLDFVLYRLPQGLGQCAGKTSVRCMAAGPRIGAARAASSSCLGATGLRAGTWDEAEQPGCPSANDNYLEALEAQPGEAYALWVNNYTSGEGFTLRFTGNALLSAEALPKADWSARVFPNPAEAELFVALDLPRPATVELTVLDALGRFVHAQEEELAAGPQQLSLNTERWNDGVYWLMVEVDGEWWFGKVEKMGG